MKLHVSSPVAGFKRNHIVLLTLFALASSTCDLAAQAHDWETVDYVNSLDYRDIEFADSLHGMAAGNWAERGRPTIRRTTDGGDTWESVLEFEIERDEDGNFVKFPVRFFAIAHPTPESAIVAADSGMMFRTYDGGKTWDSLDFETTERFRDVTLLDNSQGFASIVPTSVLQTSDGGKTWQSMQSPAAPSLRDFAYYDDNFLLCKVFLGDGYGVSRFDFNGSNWNTFKSPDERGEMFFLNPMRGWIAGFDVGEGDFGNDRIFTTTDGGETWSSLLDERIDPALGLVSINFVDEQRGIAGGYNGKILRTNDAGKTWIVDNSGIPQTIFHAVVKIDYINKDLAFAVSGNGHIVRYKTTVASVIDDQLTLKPKDIKVFPNPATQNLTISAPWICTNKQIDLFDLTGRKVFSAVGAPTSEQSINVATLQPGVYHLRVSGCEQSASQQIVIAR